MISGVSSGWALGGNRQWEGLRVRKRNLLTERERTREMMGTQFLREVREMARNHQGTETYDEVIVRTVGNKICEGTWLGEVRQVELKHLWENEDVVGHKTENTGRARRVDKRQPEENAEGERKVKRRADQETQTCGFKGCRNRPAAKAWGCKGDPPDARCEEHAGSLCVGGRVRCKCKVTEEPEERRAKRKMRAKEGGSDLTSRKQEAEGADEEESEEERRRRERKEEVISELIQATDEGSEIAFEWRGRMERGIVTHMRRTGMAAGSFREPDQIGVQRHNGETIHFELSETLTTWKILKKRNREEDEKSKQGKLQKEGERHAEGQTREEDSQRDERNAKRIRHDGTRFPKTHEGHRNLHRARNRGAGGGTGEGEEGGTGGPRRHQGSEGKRPHNPVYGRATRAVGDEERGEGSKGKRDGNGRAGLCLWGEAERQEVPAVDVEGGRGSLCAHPTKGKRLNVRTLQEGEGAPPGSHPKERKQQGANQAEWTHQRSGEEQGPSGPGGGSSESAKEGMEETEWESRLIQENPELEGRKPRPFTLSSRLAQQNDGSIKPPLTSNERKAKRLSYRSKIDKMDIHRVAEKLEEHGNTVTVQKGRRQHKKARAQQPNSPTAQQESPTDQQPSRRTLRSEQREFEETWLPIVRVTPCSPPQVGGCREGTAGGEGRRKGKKGLPDDKLPADSKD